MAYCNASVNEAHYQVLKALNKNGEALETLKLAAKYNTVTNEMLAELRSQSGCKTDQEFQSIWMV